MFFSIPYVAAERVIIGMHFGKIDAIRMAYDLSETFPSLRNIAAIDVSGIVAHQKQTNSALWVESTRLKANDPKVRKILCEIKDFSDEKKRAMGIFVQPKIKTGRRDALEPYCPSCARLTKQERRAQTDRAWREKRAAEQELPVPGRMKRTQIGQSHAESSAAGANARSLPDASPSNETIHTAGFQYGTDPQSGSPPLASSPAPASGFMPGFDDLPPHQEETDALSTSPTPEYRYPTPPQPEFPSSDAPASGFLPFSDNRLPDHAGTEAPAPGFQYGTSVHQAPSAPPQEATVQQIRNVTELPVDPLLLHLNILHANGIDLQDRQAAERLLRRMGLWPSYLL
ncbi:hypothetical protein MMC07_005733 [Pseudocyphellaria aurata]|nr:hypothetical protein [Pseudocyphellaria aurata]